MPLIFSTPEAAELAFYEALEHGDIEKMKAVWCDDDSIICIHPGAIRIEGRSDVVDSFRHMFEQAPELDFSISDVRSQQMQDLAVHLVREEIEIDGQLVSVMVSTNVYQRIGDGWRMKLHHASQEPDYDYDELDAIAEEMDTETPIVFH